MASDDIRGGRGQSKRATAYREVLLLLLEAGDVRLERVELAAQVKCAAVNELRAPHELLDGALVEVEREALARDTRGRAALQHRVAPAAAAARARAGLER